MDTPKVVIAVFQTCDDATNDLHRCRKLPRSPASTVEMQLLGIFAPAFSLPGRNKIDSELVGEFVFGCVRVVSFDSDESNWGLIKIATGKRFLYKVLDRQRNFDGRPVGKEDIKGTRDDCPDLGSPSRSAPKALSLALLKRSPAGVAPF